MTKTSAPEFTGRTNRYSGTCIDCGEFVPAGRGRLGRQGTKWVTAHDDALCGPNALPPRPYGPPAPVSLSDRIANASRRNGYLAQKLAIVDAAADHDEALARISQSCQGMTMDYMTEFSRESEAATLARAYADEKFAVAS